jgi:hypothetical protein
MGESCVPWPQFGECMDINIIQHQIHQFVLSRFVLEINWRTLKDEVMSLIYKYIIRPEVLHGLKYTEFLERYNTSSKLPKFYQDNRALKDNVSMDRHFFVIHFEGMEEFRYAYWPVREVKRCIWIEMLHVTSGNIYYLHLILLNRKACSDKDG